MNRAAGEGNSVNFVNQPISLIVCTVALAGYINYVSRTSLWFAFALISHLIS